MTKRFLICALMTLLGAGVSAGFSVAGLLGPGRYDSFARYAASRSVALLLTILIAIGIRSRVAIAFLGIAMTGVQAFDGVIGALARDPLKTYGPFALAVLNALVVGWLLREQASHRNEPVKSWPLLDQSTLIRRKAGTIPGADGTSPQFPTRRALSTRRNDR